ncbi:MAG: molybdopterin-dependent oxidoreductase [Thermodesulfobacteriota bacterium]
MEKINQKQIYDDVWIPTLCRRCMAGCGVFAHRVNGVVVRLEGNPNTYSGSRGGLCAKGLSGIQMLYDPNRLKVPLKRTNPEKGLNIDPKWKEISWDEALDEIAARVKKVMDEDPSKILIQSGVTVAPTGSLAWRLLLATVLSTPKGRALITSGGTGTHCGNGGHVVMALTHGAWIVSPDYRYCNYLVVFGSNWSLGNGAQFSTRLAAEALDRGMKVVVFDPVCNFAAFKATEWVPLLPGTDAAVGLAMLNVIVNELGIYDAVYLKNKTNAPYLVGSDGRYIRDGNTNRPMVWDAAESKAKNYDDLSIGDFALEGLYEVNGVKCRPAWTVLKEHLKKYTPDKAFEISTVPAATIRRIAAEMANAAMVGATITIEGKQLPLRPVATFAMRGSEAHHNATHTAFVLDLLNQVFGAADVPGGLLGIAGKCLGYPETGLPNMGYEKGVDGFLTVAGKWVIPHKPWPKAAPSRPAAKDLRDLFVMEEISPMWGVSDREEVLRKAGIDPTIEVMLAYGTNPVMSQASPRDQAEFLRKIPFIVGWELYETEFIRGFADIVLPDTCYLENSDWTSIYGYFWNQPPGMDPWCFHTVQEVVKPQHSRRFVLDVTHEILDRMGLRAKVNEYWNGYAGFSEANKISPTEKITSEQLGDRILKHYFGPDHDWEWFKKHGFVSWPKKVEEVYWRYFLDARVHVYREFLIGMGQDIQKIGKELGIEMDWQQYTALPEWFPCPPHLVKDPHYDLYCFSYRDPLHSNSHTMEQPWLDELSMMNPYTYKIVMNAGTAKQKGLKEGDIIELESDKGNRVQGMLQVRNAQHSQAVAIMGTAGHWSPSLPIARGKGVHFNSLMELRWDECDPITLSYETCVKVKVNKAGAK